jgi:hypothetical protein
VLCPSVAKDLCMKQGEGPVPCADTELCWTDGDPCPTDVPCLGCDVGCDTYHETSCGTACDIMGFEIVVCYFDECTETFCQSYGG